MNRMDVEHLVERMAMAWMQRDVTTIVALFTDDGVFVTPGGIARGQAAIATAATTFFARPNTMMVTITRVIVDGSQGAVEWTWRETSGTTGADRTMEDAIIFALRDDKVAYWREYFDPTQSHAL
jgi:uncharacterized protein (TIGR02246 family)